MFGHLDDPSPLAPTSRTLRGVLRRSARRRRRRLVAVVGGGAAVAVLLVAVIGITVTWTRGGGQSFAGFNSEAGTLPVGTPVPLVNLADVVFITDSRGFGLAFHGAGTVLASTTDGGVSWRVVNAHLPADLPAQMEFADSTHGYLWGGTPSADGAVPLWVTSDGGRHWSAASVGPVVSDVSAIGADVWAVVDSCPAAAATSVADCSVAVEVSVDDGLTWRTTPAAPPVTAEPGVSGADEDLELARITTARAYVLSFGPTRAGAAPAGSLGYTPDNGATWQQRPDPCPPSTDAGQEIAASGTEDLWMVCGSDPDSGSQTKNLYRSHDGGLEWDLTASTGPSAAVGTTGTDRGAGLPAAGYVSPYSLGHQNLAVLTPTEAWLYPDRSGVFATTDGGRTWSLASALSRAGLVGGGSGNIVFVDAAHGWVCEVGGGLWRTTDGRHWTHLDASPG